MNRETEPALGAGIAKSAVNITTQIIRKEVITMAVTPTSIVTPKFALNRHILITQSAAFGVLTDEEVQLVILANLAQDIRQSESQVHFDNCAFAEGSFYIEKQWEMIDSYRDRRSKSSLNLFGRLLHTVQDFYAHSNWVEIHLNEAPVPMWNCRSETLPEAIISGTWPTGEPKRCSSNAPHHDQLNKDKPSSITGCKVVDFGPHHGKTLFELAEEVSIRATRQQLERLLQTTLRIPVKIPEMKYGSIESLNSLISVLVSWTEEAQRLRDLTELRAVSKGSQ
jgi:hypothetical protein